MYPLLKKIAPAILIALNVSAQKNVFLEREFWKNKPAVSAIKNEIARGNDPSRMNGSGFDATVYAIIEQAPDETIRYLLSQKGNEANKLTHDGRTYIFWAAYKGNITLMNYLLSQGAKTNLVDDHGYTILNFAAANGQTNTAVYDLCLKNGANLKKDLDHNDANALLLIAPFDKDFSLINYFVSKGLDLNSTDANGNTAFNYAARTGNIPFMQALIKKGVKFNDQAMIMASQGTRSTANTLELYNYLETLGIKPTATGKNGENALHAIVKKEKQGDIIPYFILKGVSIDQQDQDGNTPLMNAASSNREQDVITLLASRSKNINHTNKKGASALALAVQYNTYDAVNTFLSNGADVKVVNTNGDNLAFYLFQSYTAEKQAVFEAKLKQLTEKGLDLSAPQKNGNTLYHLAVAKNDPALLKKAEAFKVNVNAKNSEGYTALHKAAMTAQDDVLLKELLLMGAKKEELTSFKESAFDLAKENELLRKNNTSLDFLK